MTAEVIAAVGSMLSVVVLAVASVVALMQLKHLRLANQLDSYAHYTEEIQSPEMIEARAFLESLDVSDSATIERVTTPVLDRRLALFGAHFQCVCGLLNIGVLDEKMFAMYFSLAPQVWRMLKPIAYLLRERDEQPRWLDIERIAFVSVLIQLGLAILGWGGFSAFFSHASFDALVGVTVALTIVSTFSEGSLSAGGTAPFREFRRRIRALSGTQVAASSPDLLTLMEA